MGFTYSYSYKVETIYHETTDIRTNWDTDVEWDNTEYLKLSKTINKYLWFFMWTVSLIVVVYAWFLLMSSNWSDEDLKKWNKMLIWGLVWIFVSLLAYVIIRLLIDLF